MEPLMREVVLNILSNQREIMRALIDLGIKDTRRTREHLMERMEPLHRIRQKVLDYDKAEEKEKNSQKEARP